MTPMQHVQTTCGWHNPFRVENTEEKPNLRSEVWVLNIANVAGYIPGVSLVTGVARAVFCTMLLLQNLDNPNKNPRKAICFQIARGVTEALGLGFVFVVADVAITIMRSQGKAASLYT